MGIDGYRSAFAPLIHNRAERFEMLEASPGFSQASQGSALIPRERWFLLLLLLLLLMPMMLLLLLLKFRVCLRILIEGVDLRGGDAEYLIEGIRCRIACKHNTRLSCHAKLQKTRKQVAA